MSFCSDFIKWKEDRAAKTTEEGKPQQKYLRLKDEIREVEIVRKAAERIAREIEPLRKAPTSEPEI